MIIHKRYLVDLLSGACVAQIKIEKEYGLSSKLYSFNGNVFASIPITANNMNDYIRSITSGVVSGISSGNLVQSGATLVQAGLNSLFGTTKQNIVKNGSAGGISGFLNTQRPYLIISRPDQSLAKNYNEFN